MRRHIFALSAGIARHRELCSIDRSIRRRELLYLHHYAHTHGLTHNVYYDVLLGNPFKPRVYQLILWLYSASEIISTLDGTRLRLGTPEPY